MTGPIFDNSSLENGSFTLEKSSPPDGLLPPLFPPPPLLESIPPFPLLESEPPPPSPLWMIIMIVIVIGRPASNVAAKKHSECFNANFGVSDGKDHHLMRQDSIDAGGNIEMDF